MEQMLLLISNHNLSLAKWMWKGIMIKRKTRYCEADVGISASLANASAPMFQLPTLKLVVTCINMTTDIKHFILCS
jgi:hypothetical protein